VKAGGKGKAAKKKESSASPAATPPRRAPARAAKPKALAEADDEDEGAHTRATRPPQHDIEGRSGAVGFEQMLEDHDKGACAVPRAALWPIAHFSGGRKRRRRRF
jgi:hypothetical protein